MVCLYTGSQNCLQLIEMFVQIAKFIEKHIFSLLQKHQALNWRCSNFKLLWNNGDDIFPEAKP